MQPMERWEIFLGLGLLLFFAFYAYSHVDWEDMFRQQPATPLHMEGKINNSIPLKNVQMVNIPAEIYNAMKQNPDNSKYLQGNEKYILMISTYTCPYARAFKYAFQTLFREYGYKKYYRKHIFNVGHSISVSCRSEHCPTIWIFNNCGNGFCIINPKLKQAVIDNSQDATQIARTLEKYKDW